MEIGNETAKWGNRKNKEDEEKNTLTFYLLLVPTCREEINFNLTHLSKNM